MKIIIFKKYKKWYWTDFNNKKTQMMTQIYEIIYLFSKIQLIIIIIIIYLLIKIIFFKINLKPYCGTLINFNVGDMKMIFIRFATIFFSWQNILTKHENEKKLLLNITKFVSGFEKWSKNFKMKQNQLNLSLAKVLRRLHYLKWYPRNWQF